MNGVDTTGAKLQALVDGKCIKSRAAAELPAEQKAAIENLTQDQINTCIDVRRLVGEVHTADFI